MTILDVYSSYKIHPNLQLHMFRVASLAQLIVDNWCGDPLDYSSIIQACLFHDFAKIIKFDHFDVDSEYWTHVQKEMIEKYGHDDYAATIKICNEIGISTKVIDLLNTKNMKPYIDRVRNIFSAKTFEIKILQYCDARISPDGLVTLTERYDELMTRDSTKKMDDTAKESMRLLFKIEEQIQEYTKINLSEINPEIIEMNIKDIRESVRI